MPPSMNLTPAGVALSRDNESNATVLQFRDTLQDVTGGQMPGRDLALTKGFALCFRQA
jgi:hypothetical protein